MPCQEDGTDMADCRFALNLSAPIFTVIKNIDSSLLSVSLHASGLTNRINLFLRGSLARGALIAVAGVAGLEFGGEELLRAGGGDLVVGVVEAGGDGHAVVGEQAAKGHEFAFEGVFFA